MDTHTILWSLREPERIFYIVAELLQDQSLSVISLVSLWEIAIKLRLGKPGFTFDFKRFIEGIAQSKINMLGLEIHHLKVFAKLEKFENHKDPFGQLLVAQCLAEDYILISMDRKLSQYPIPILWA